MMKDQQVLIRLSREEKERAMMYAGNLGLSLSGFVRMLVNTYAAPEKPTSPKREKIILEW